MNFNNRQRKVIYAEDPNILCLAASASGKTRVLTERVRVLLEDREVSPKDIVAITFTNLAADEMRRRLGDRGKGMFIGTIHSYANDICYNNQIDTTEFIQKEEFDKILVEAIKLPKQRYPKIKHLLVDECQDLCPLEYQFLSRIPADNRFFVGDNRQAIYQFKGSTDAFLKGMWRDASYAKYYLTENYRNAPNIIDFADDFLKSAEQLSPHSVAVKQKDGIVEKTSFDEALDNLEADGNWGAWFVLTRTNAELEEAQRRLNERGIPNVTFKKADLDNKMLEGLMKSNKVKVLTIHSCMSGDTLIVTQKGIKTIKEVVNEQNYDNLVYNGKYFDKVKEFINNGVEMTYTITSKTGKSIRLTENHDVIVLTNEGIKKIKVKDLQGGENLLLRKNFEDAFSKITLEQIKKEEVYHNATIYPTPQELTPELSELIGMITADGTHNPRSIHYCKRYKECVDRFAELIKILFNKNIEVKKEPNKDMWIAECNSTYIIKFLYQNFNGINNNDKFISSKILESSSENICAFLRGLFEDGAVQLKKGNVDSITLTYKNPKMTYQLQTLLLKLGIDASFTSHDYKDRDLNYCYIYSTGLTPFKEKIGFISKFKQDRLDSFEQKYQRKNKSSVFRQLMLNNKDKLFVSGYSKFWSNLKKNLSLTDGGFFQYYECLSEKQKQLDCVKFIKDIFENYIVEEIVSIEQFKEEETYCLTMEHESQFIQNGFLMGNSKGLEAPRVIVTGAKVYNLEERKIAYVAATRAEFELYWCPSISTKRRKKSTKTPFSNGVMNFG